MNDTTPYDDVTKTLCIDCPQLLIPMVNETFHEDYTGDEKVIIGNETHFLPKQKGETDKRITDSHFTILGKEKIGRYHIESQSTEDNTMQIRMFEYDTQIALEHAKVTKEGLIVELPQAAVIYLRSSSNTPEELKVMIRTPGGNITYDIPIIKLKSYTLDELFEKKLYFLIPFHIFVYENQFLLYNSNKDKLSELKEKFKKIVTRLHELSDDGKMDEFTKHCLLDMTTKVAKNLTAKHEHVQKGICEVMGGKVLDYEAKRIYNAGRNEGWNAGRSEGWNAGALNTCISLIQKGLLSLTEAAKQLSMSEAELQKYL